MNPANPIVGTGLASCCSILSVFGVIFLTVIGFAFDANAEVLMGHKTSPADGHAVALSCWYAAAVYAGFVALCGCQVGLNRRPRGSVRI